MGWHNISPVSRYESSNRNAFIVEDISKGAIGMVIYPKAFQKFDDVYKIV